MLVAQLLALAAIAGLLALLVWRVVQGSSGADLVTAIERGDRPVAPAFDLPLLSSRPLSWPLALREALGDGRVALAELRGTPVVLNFWASWCIPCKEEAPALDAAAMRYRNEVAFLGLNIQDFVRDAKRFLTRLEIRYPSVREGGSASFDAYGLTGLPETYFIDDRGRIVGHVVGALSRDELERELAILLGEST